MADADYAAYFLASPPSVVQLETLEIHHPAFSRRYWIVRNKTDGLFATLETGAPQAFDYYPLRIRPLGVRADLDFGIAVELGDLGEVIPREIDRIMAADERRRPVVRYRTFRSDDLSKPLLGPLHLEMQSIAMRKEGAAFEARAPRLSLDRTGETYDLVRFAALRGFL